MLDPFSVIEKITQIQSENKKVLLRDRKRLQGGRYPDLTGVSPAPPFLPSPPPGKGPGTRDWGTSRKDLGPKTGKVSGTRDWGIPLLPVN